MPGSGTTPHQTDTPGYFNQAFLDLSYFEFTPGDKCSQDVRSPQLTPPPTSPGLHQVGRSSPGIWGSGANSPRLEEFQPFGSGLPRIDAQSPGIIAPDQATAVASNSVMGNPSPPDSSESSPQKFVAGGDISPLDSYIAVLPETTRTVHGQITPPDETMRSPKIASLPGLSFPFTLAQPAPRTPRNSVSLSPKQQPLVANDTKKARKESTSSKRRRSSAEQSGSRKPRKSSTSEDLPEIQEAKRRRFLERNRVAASKCRQKKKMWMQELEADAREAQATSRNLKSAVSLLKEEVLQLKNELLKHNTCDCTPIRQYLSNEAVKLVSAGHAADGPPAERRTSTVSDTSIVSDPDLKADTTFDLDIVGSPEETQP